MTRTPRPQLRRVRFWNERRLPTFAVSLLTAALAGIWLVTAARPHTTPRWATHLYHHAAATHLNSPWATGTCIAIGVMGATLVAAAAMPRRTHRWHLPAVPAVSATTIDDRALRAAMRETVEQVPGLAQVRVRTHPRQIVVLARGRFGSGERWDREARQAVQDLLSRSGLPPLTVRVNITDTTRG